MRLVAGRALYANKVQNAKRTAQVDLQLPGAGGGCGARLFAAFEQIPRDAVDGMRAGVRGRTLLRMM